MQDLQLSLPPIEDRKNEKVDAVEWTKEFSVTRAWMNFERFI